MQMPLNDEVVRSFKAGRIFKESTKQVNSIDFHRVHDLLVTAGDDDHLHVYDTAEGRHLATVPSLKYGCQNVVWTHSPEKIVFASNKEAGSSPIEKHALRYCVMGTSGKGASFEQYFFGHTARVTKIAVNPKNDTMLSAAQDKEIRLWDLRVPQCQAVLQAHCQPTVAFDQQGLVFAVGLDNGSIKLYDAGNYEQGPFENFVVAELRNSPVPFAHLHFSNDGKQLVAVHEGKIFVLDAFTGAVMKSFSNQVSEAGASPDASLSYDGQFLLSGCADHSLRVWHVSTAAVVAEWKGHVGVPYCAKWAPRRLFAASACSAVCLWIPSPEAVNKYMQQ